ncbi:haloacid dehalogenase [Planctomycetota bacterium]|nr:haloacid dehalogenase [Planctomycetota bacterium]
MMRAAVILDLDGTLVDSRTDLAASANAGRAALGFAPLPDAAITSFVGDGAARLIERATPEVASLPASAALREQALAAFRADYDRRCTATTFPYAGIDQALQRLADAGWLLGVATNKPLGPTRAILAATGLDRWIGFAHGGDAIRKPDPAAIHSVLVPLGCAAAASWMVGDHHTDLIAGQAAGCRTLFCTWGFGRREGAHADAVAATPAELPEILGRP